MSKRIAAKNISSSDLQNIKQKNVHEKLDGFNPLALRITIQQLQTPGGHKKS